jgi:hypothetical protein
VWRVAKLREYSLVCPSCGRYCLLMCLNMSAYIQGRLSSQPLSSLIRFRFRIRKNIDNHYCNVSYTLSNTPNELQTITLCNRVENGSVKILFYTIKAKCFCSATLVSVTGSYAIQQNHFSYLIRKLACRS